MPSVSIEEASGNLHGLIESLSPGEELVITERQEPVAKLISTRGASQRPVPKLGTQRGCVLSMERFDDPLEDFAEHQG
ncbi:MAG: type II toxin-antitoxin system Phd/YefM family antitoxin [Planctomycetota bacterium]|jgi:antitoxin (DNA-binding transcriptional repressor) of toxin-antitoxin stability system|nr:hypothetical protein [Planctomycetota bacterium]